MRVDGWPRAGLSAHVCAPYRQSPSAAASRPARPARPRAVPALDVGQRRVGSGPGGVGRLGQPGGLPAPLLASDRGPALPDMPGDGGVGRRNGGLHPDAEFDLLAGGVPGREAHDGPGVAGAQPRAVRMALAAAPGLECGRLERGGGPAGSSPPRQAPPGHGAAWALGADGSRGYGVGFQVHP